MNKKPGAGGKVLLYLQSFINGRRSKRSLGVSVVAKFFDKEAGLVVKDHPDANDVNIVLRNKIAKANSIAARYRILEEMNGVRLTPAIFEKEFFASGENKGNFLKWYEGRMKYRYNKKIVEYNTYRNERTTLNKLKAYCGDASLTGRLKTKCPVREKDKERKALNGKISFADLTPEFMRDFNLWMISIGNDQNTRWGQFKHLHSYLEEAIEEGIYIGDPFKGLDVHLVDGPIVFLEQEEIKRLQKYYKSRAIPERHRTVLRRFLFSCFTGLRISDSTRMKFNNIVNGCLVFVPHKNRKKGKFITMPLSKPAKIFIETEGFKVEELFDDYEDPVTNRILKEIAEAVKIKKHITFHVARHTFATVYLELGGQVQVLQQYLGHSKIATTMRYVHVSDRVKQKEIKRFDKM